MYIVFNNLENSNMNKISSYLNIYFYFVNMKFLIKKKYFLENSGFLEIN